MFKKVDHIAIAVRNLEESKKRLQDRKMWYSPEKNGPTPIRCPMEERQNLSLHFL
jgi:hypothetical protein